MKRVNLWMIAARNLSRHRLKTVLTAVAVMVGVSLYIFLDAWFLGMDTDSERNIVNYETGSLKIYSKGYFAQREEKPMYETFSDYQKMIRILDENGWNATPRISFGGQLISKTQDMPFAFIGVDAGREKTVLHYDEFLEAGRMPRRGKFEILLGWRGAASLDVKVGDPVRLYTVIDKKGERGEIRRINQVIDLTVCGIVHSPNPKTNGSIGYLPLDILQDEMGLLLNGAITEIAMRKKGCNTAMLPDRSESVRVAKKILGAELPEDLILVSWETEAQDFLTLTKTKSTASKMMSLLLLFLAFIGIANTILMATLERSREIGMMRALGMTDAQVRRIFLYEAGLIGWIGSCGGGASRNRD